MPNQNIEIQEYVTVTEAADTDTRGNETSFHTYTETTLIYTADVLTVDPPTENGNIYPRAVVEAAIAEYQHKIKREIAIGTTRRDIYTGEVIPLHSISHVITEMQLQGDVVRVTAKVVPTRQGKALISVISPKNPFPPTYQLVISGHGVRKPECLDRDAVPGTHTIEQYTIISVDFMPRDA